LFLLFAKKSHGTDCDTTKTDHDHDLGMTAR
jgi:hypothetical protein